jgi:ferredoxin-like protein FixX
MKKDINYIAKLEKAIASKYGHAAVQNPKGSWDEEKEKEYLQQLEKIYQEKVNHATQDEKIEVNGFLVSRKLINKDTNRTCPVCKNYSFNVEDDVYMSKFDCCSKCHVEYIEGREEKWKTGWRPKKENN